MSSFSEFKEDLARRSQQLDEKEAENEQKLKELAESIPNLLKFDAVSSIFSDLEIVQTESKTFRTDVNKLKNVSERLNQSVSRIQSVWTRVNDCGKQIDELIHLKTSSETIQLIIKQGDYETAAEHVCRFLEIDKIIPKPTIDAIQRGAGGDDRLDISKSIKTLIDATDQLKTLVQYKFNDAVAAMDFVAVQRFCKISFLIGLSDDALRLLCQFMKKKLDESCQENLKFARNLSKADQRHNLIFDEVFAMLFESIGILLEENYRLVETHFGKRKFLKIVQFLQNECDSQINEILMEFMKSRKMQNLSQNISDFMDSNSKSQLSKIDSKELDVLIDEMVLIHSRFELYFRFLRQKTMTEIENSDFNSEEKSTEIDKLDNLLKSCEAQKCKTDIFNNYLIFEKYYLTESVNKAIELDVLQSGQKTTSMVDDVFFLLKKCLRRAIMSNSLDAIRSLTNEIGAILESNYCDLLGKRLKQGYSRSTLDTIHAYTIGKSTINLKNKQQFDELVNHIITLNNVEISIEFIDEISHNLLTKKAMKIPLYDDEENGLKTVSREFAKFKKKFEEHLEFGLQQLQVHVIRPKISSWIDPFLLVNFKMTEEELINYEAGESFVQTVIQNMDSLIALLKDSFSDKNFDKLLSLLTMELTTQLEILIRKTKFSRLGGLILDKELRQLTSYMTNIASWSIRDKFTRILQIATVLNFEQVSEIFDFHSTMSYKFSEDELKQILKLRVDFIADDIRKIKL